MVKNFLTLMVFIASCSTLKENPITPEPKQPPEPASNTKAVIFNKEVTEGASKSLEPVKPVEVKPVFKVKIIDTNYTKPQKEKLLKAQDIIEKVVNSKEYKEMVLNHSFNNSKSFFENQNMTNSQIYNTLFLGEEKLNHSKNNQMDLTVTMYNSRFTSTVGYTYPDSMVVFTNLKYHQHFTPCRVASNLVHEWTHKIGFTHSLKWTKERDYTVPYAHNMIIESLCSKAELGQLTGI
jgi:hypothetical protein